MRTKLPTLSKTYRQKNEPYVFQHRARIYLDEVRDYFL